MRVLICIVQCLRIGTCAAAARWLATLANDVIRLRRRVIDENLRQAFQRETELLFDSVVHEDRNVFDLLNADYTFVNERLARHYGIPNVYGTDFRRVPVSQPARRGLLGMQPRFVVGLPPIRLP